MEEVNSDMSPLDLVNLLKVAELMEFKIEGAKYWHPRMLFGV